MKDECIICKAPLEYLAKDMEMECSICHKKEYSKTRCINGHYVCNECHTKGIDTIIGLCLNTESIDPIEIIRMMMAQPFCHMHGPEHHVMVGSALLTAYKNAGGELELEEALLEMQSRGKKVPGGACGFWGACGAGISTGMFVSINGSVVCRELLGYDLSKPAEREKIMEKNLFRTICPEMIRSAVSILDELLEEYQ